jgi:hypothetical protein
MVTSPAGPGTKNDCAGEALQQFTLPDTKRSYIPVTVAARSNALNVFVRSNTGIVGSNPTRGMDVCPRFFCVCVVLCR